MTRFFFHVTHRDPRVDDTVGTELPDQEAAWDEATRACGEMIKEIDGKLSVGTDWVMDVDDGSGPLFTIHFGATRHARPRSD